jgi:hypothetical protein
MQLYEDDIPQSGAFLIELTSALLKIRAVLKQLFLMQLSGQVISRVNKELFNNYARLRGRIADFTKVNQKKALLCVIIWDLMNKIGTNVHFKRK